MLATKKPQQPGTKRLVKLKVMKKLVSATLAGMRAVQTIAEESDLLKQIGTKVQMELML